LSIEYSAQWFEQAVKDVPIVIASGEARQPIAL
jgi:hypothetical protein